MRRSGRCPLVAPLDPTPVPRRAPRRFLGGLLAGAGMAALPAAALARLGSEHRLALALVRPGSPEGAAALAGFDLTHARVGDAVEVLLWSGDGARLDRLGLDWEVTVPDVIAQDRVQGAGTAAVAAAGADGRTSYRLLVDYEDDLHRWADAHPDRARIRQLPQRTEEGRAGVRPPDRRRRAPSGRPACLLHGRPPPRPGVALRRAHHDVRP